ncbi:MAG TPA: Gfo/Idh/MocA family oxidoreductase [Hyphomicrobiaceae bacterium]|nr:Gfo/Idh/MocA family oxidoreductase [Hyphomicrobiaceae bacterium]
MINIAVIGYGYWGPNLARCVAETDGCNLAAVVDQSSAALARAGKRHPSAKLVENWPEVLADPAIDAVMIATPVDTHFEIGLAALNAGKHVLVEKPMTSNSREAATLVELAAKRKRVLMVDHTFVYTPAVQKIRDLIVEGSIGQIYYYHSTRINLGLFQRDVNVIWDLAVHDLAILDYVFDTRPVAVSASGAGHIQGAPENMAHIALFYPNGFVAHLNVNWLAPVKIRQTLIGGSRRMIVYDDLEPSEKIKVYDRGVNLNAGPEEVNKIRVSYRVGDMWAPHLSVKEALRTEVEHFVACVTEGATPTTSGLNGLHVVEMLESAVGSLKQRGHPVEIAPMRLAS